MRLQNQIHWVLRKRMENPYAPPKTNDLSAPIISSVYISGKALVIPKDFTFPTICIKTGETENLVPLRKRRLSWCPPLMVILIVAPLIFILVAIFFQKRGLIHYQLSKKVARKRRNALWINWLLLFAYILFTFVSVTSKKEGIPLFGIAGVVLLFTSLIRAVIAGRFLRAEKIDKLHIHLLGIPPEVQRRILELCQPQE